MKSWRMARPFNADDVIFGTQRGASRGAYLLGLMQTRATSMEPRTREEQEKLKLLRSLAAEGFDQLDQGQGIEIDRPERLADYIAGVGRRAAMRAESPRNAP